MTDFLIELAALTLGGSVAVIVLALTARLSRARYAARWRCWLWLLLCIRLAIPVSIQLPEQVEVETPIQITVPSDPVIYTYQPEQPMVQQPKSELPFQDDPVTPIPDVDFTGPSNAVQLQPKQEITLYQIVFVVWVVGAVAVLFWYVFSHLRFLRWMRRWGNPVVNSGTIRVFNELGDKLGLNARPGLLFCTGLHVPVLVGVLSPKLLLPEGEMGESALRYSLIHELTHFKRRDIWLKTIALLVNAVHWFNPLMRYSNKFCSPIFCPFRDVSPKVRAKRAVVPFEKTALTIMYLGDKVLYEKIDKCPDK